MRKAYCGIMAFVIMAVFAFGSCAAVGKQEGGQQDDWELIEEAYIFAFPLVLLDSTAENSTNTVEPTDNKAPVNQFIHASTLADAGARFVVTPNVDTVYTQVFLDLSDDAMVYKKPAADRFLSVELMDAYTNCVKVLGTGGDTRDEKTYLIAGPGFEGKTPDGMELVEIPTNKAWMLARTMVEGNDDLDNVYALQDLMELTPLGEYGNGYSPPKGTYDENNDYVPIDHVLDMAPEEFFAKANELMIKNPPAEADKEIVERMKTISVGAGLTFDAGILGEDGADKWANMLSGLEGKLVERSAHFMEKMGIWEFYGEPIAKFGTEYDYRALIALGGLGANPISVAIYPKAEADNDNNILSGINSYTLHFDKAPPVNEYGFWSVTAYGEDNFLIDNEINRYAINDRGNLKFNDDGSLDILIQAGPPEDETMMENWLPVKAEQFHLHLRVYLPDSSILDGGWNAPGISTI